MSDTEKSGLDEHDSHSNKGRVFTPDASPGLILRYSPDIREKLELPPLPFSLKQFQIADFLCIRRTGIEGIPLEAPWIFITGENGTGKTSLLHSLLNYINVALNE